MSFRAALIALATALLLPAAAPAAPASREAAAGVYRDMLAAQQVPAGWTGSVEGCAVREESAASIAATLQTVNGLRDLAGLAPVSFDTDLNRKALAAALMMRAAGALSHEPGPEWPCYSAEGDEGAGRSNLFLGASGPAAMIGYVDDSGVGSLGHRRWVLDPGGATWGTGSTGSTNALLVIGGAPSAAPVPELVAWPPPGYLPWPLVFADWSAAISNPGVDLSNASVAVTVDGQPRAVSGTTDLGEGFGTGATLKWNVALAPGDTTAPRQVAVAIDALVDGAPRRFAYQLEAFPMQRVPARLKVLRARVRRGKLVVRLGLTPLADGGTVRMKLRAGRDVVRVTAPVRNGRVTFKGPVPDRTLKLTFRYSGNDAVRPASVKRKIT